ncbi:MAG: hypothetical protein Q4E77_03890 [Conchiformibius sp.]|nr:hypothetical protein [Conchiformibius sp.]
MFEVMEWKNMGIIFDDVSKKDGEFIHAGDAMEYLVFVERNEVNFRQIGEFLHKYRFDERMAGAAYHRDLKGIYYDADNPIDWERWQKQHGREISFICQPVNEDGKEFSPHTEEFIENMCSNNSTIKHDELLGDYDFELFFRKETFINAVQIMFSQAANQPPDKIKLPNLDDFVARRNPKNPVTNKQAEPTTKARNKQAEIIAALAVMFTKTDCTQPYEAAETIRQEWQRQADKLGNPPDKNTLAKYIQYGLERLQS